MALVDTDVMVDILRQYPPASEWLRSLGDQQILVPGFVAMELIQGCTSLKDQSVVKRMLRPAAVIWLTPSECDSAFQLYSRFHLSHNLGLLDSLIAQTAVSHGLSLNTFNTKHYSAVPGLATQQPYER